MEFNISTSNDENDNTALEDYTEHAKDNGEQNYEEDTYNNDHVDSKTLKYQFQSVQNELKRKIELLESISNGNKSKIEELNKALDEEKVLSHQQSIENENLKQELIVLQQKWKDSCNENQQYKDKIRNLVSDLETAQERLKEADYSVIEKYDEVDTTTVSNSIVAYDHLVNLQEELVFLKERFAQVGEEKVKLQRELLTMTENYNMLCNRSYNKYFFYVAPLVFMVLYLLISAMIS